MRKCSKQFTRRQSTFFKDGPIKIKMWTNDQNNTEQIKNIKIFKKIEFMFY